MEPEWAVLADAGAAALVGAAGTDAWKGIRDGFVRLFGRRGTQAREVAGIQLDEVSEAAREIPGEDGDGLRVLQRIWQQRLMDLLAERPEAAGELRTMIDGAARDTAGRVQVSVQRNVARSGGMVVGVQHGDVVIHKAAKGLDEGS
jgi:hypothetical protein